MIEKETQSFDLHWRQHRAEFVFSAALLLRQINHEDHDISLELKAMVQRLDEIGFDITRSGLVVQPTEQAV